MSAVLLLMASILADPGAAPVDFDTEIVPMVTKAGCNSGACHGAALGRGSFKLSLYGGDPEADYRSIVLELEGRRVNTARPEESLVVLKAAETISHGGGMRWEAESPAAMLMQRWIGEGAGRTRSRELAEFHVSPQSHRGRVGDQLQLAARAQFDDGSAADVTQSTVFTAVDAAAVKVDPESATAKLLLSGRHLIVARYLDQSVPIEVLVPVSDAPVDLSQASRNNFIDDHIVNALSQLRLPAAPQADDAALLRRLTLDLTGRLPTTDEQLAYRESREAGKYEDMVDQLLESEAFNDYWTYRFASLLRIRSQAGDAQSLIAYHGWLKAQIAGGTPYNRLAEELLLATGDSREVGPANFYRTGSGPRELAEFVSEVFLGNRLRCANCHNHPLDRWTQDDYHGLAAIFARLDRGREIRLASRGEVIHPRSGEPALPRIPGVRYVDEAGDPRVPLVEWLTGPENPYFAKAIVNRLWQAMMGRGLVEPVDDLRATNPATHPALLEELAADFIEHDYDLRHTLRRIARSAAYRRGQGQSALGGAGDLYYSHALRRPLPAEVLADAIADVLGIAERYGDNPLGTRAVALVDPATDSVTLDVLGRCARADSCEHASTETAGLTQMLHLLNGPALNRRIGDPQGRLATLLREGKPPGQIVEEFYLRALCRLPTAEESAYWNRQWEGLGDPRQQQLALEDFLWSLLTCREFTTNH